MSTGTYKSSSHGAMEFQLQKYHVKYLIRETVFYNGRNTDLVHRERLVLVVCSDFLYNNWKGPIRIQITMHVKFRNFCAAL